MIIKKVFKTKANNQKMVIIPARSDVEDGDYVLIKKIKEEDLE